MNFKVLLRTELGPVKCYAGQETRNMETRDKLNANNIAVKIEMLMGIQFEGF